MSDTVLEARNLRVLYRTKRGPVRAVDGVSFDLRAGETLGVVGETGSGKSTLGKAVLGILPPGTTKKGELLFERKNLLTLPDGQLRRLRGKEIALIFQDPMTRLDPLMTIEDHFLETIRAHESVSAEEARERTLEGQILEILEDLKRAYGMSLLLITHNLGIVAEVCDTVGVMYAGLFVEYGPVRDVFKRPIHPYTRGLLASIIHLDSSELVSIDGLPPDLVTPPAGCRFHPRCPYVQDVCRTTAPEWVEYRPGHFALCHFGRDFL